MRDKNKEDLLSTNLMIDYNFDQLSELIKYSKKVKNFERRKMNNFNEVTPRRVVQIDEIPWVGEVIPNSLIVIVLKTLGEPPPTALYLKLAKRIISLVAVEDNRKWQQKNCPSSRKKINMNNSAMKLQNVF